MTQPVWKISSPYTPRAAPLASDDLDLALADIDATGAVLGISNLGRREWGWNEGERVPEAVFEALRNVAQGAPRALPVQHGGFSLVGLSHQPEPGWLLIGYSVEAARAEPASTFKSLIENAAVSVLRMDADGRVRFAGAETTAFTGYAADEITGRQFWRDVVHPEDRWKLTEALRRVTEERRKTTLDVRFLTARQELRLARFYLLPPLLHQHGAYIDALIFDVTKQVAIEDVLVQSEVLYRTFLEQSPMGLLHLDVTGVVTFENHTFRQIVGEGVDDAWIGRSLDEITGLDPRLWPLVERMLHRGDPLRGEAVTYRRHGEVLPAHLVVHGSPIRQPGGEIVGGVMMIEDVTEQRRREEELILRERYEQAEVALRAAVLDDLNEAVFLHETAAILGETAQADRIHMLVHLGDEGTCISRAVWVQDEQDEPFSLFAPTSEFALLRHAVVNGENVYLRASNAASEAQRLLELTEAEEVLWIPFYDNERLGGFVLFERTLPPVKGPAGFWQEVEQHLMAHLVRQFETLWSWIQVGRRYRLTVATISDCLFTFTFSRHGTRRYLFITPQVAALTGYAAEEVLAHSDSVLPWIEQLVHPDDQALLHEHDEALRNGRESKVTYRVAHQDGSVRWLCEHATSHRDATGRVTVNGILMDVTEQKDVEAVLQSVQEQALSASRLKNSFVATMSHELRTPLGALSGFAELLGQELAEWEVEAEQKLPPQVHEFTEAVRQNARRLLQLADDLFTLSNMEIGTLRLDRTAVPVHPLVQRAASSHAVVLAEKEVKLTVECAPDDLVALCDGPRMKQVLDILLSNAVKFTDEGQVTIRTRSAGAEVCIEVSDTGIGMDEAYLGQLFTPFLQEDSRLNRRYPGTGLGLALVKRLLDLMGGRIEVESEKHKGSTFRVFLPAARE